MEFIWMDAVANLKASVNLFYLATLVLTDIKIIHVTSSKFETFFTPAL